MQLKRKNGNTRESHNIINTAITNLIEPTSNPSTSHKENKNRKKELMYDLRVREAIEIRKHNSGPGRGLNEDHGAYFKTDMWDPVLGGMT